MKCIAKICISAPHCVLFCFLPHSTSWFESFLSWHTDIVHSFSAYYSILRLSYTECIYSPTDDYLDQFSFSLLESCSKQAASLYMSLCMCVKVSLMAHTVKNLPATWETWVWFLGWEDPLEKCMATHSLILAWRIPMDRGAWQTMVHGVTESDITEWLSTAHSKSFSRQLSILKCNYQAIGNVQLVH